MRRSYGWGRCLLTQPTGYGREWEGDFLSRVSLARWRAVSANQRRAFYAPSYSCAPFYVKFVGHPLPPVVIGHGACSPQIRDACTMPPSCSTASMPSGSSDR